MKNKKIIAVTGKQGSGKSTFCNLLAKEINADVLNLDIYAHKVLLNEDVKNILITKFGTSIVKDNQIDRKKLGEIVFNDDKQLKFLNALVYKYMVIDIDKDIQNSNKNIILDYALLPQTKYWNLANYKILINASKNMRLKRLAKRDNVNTIYLQKRENQCMDYSNIQFDIVLQNNENTNMQNLVNKVINKFFSKNDCKNLY